MAKADNLLQRISTHYPQLSETAQSIANFLQRNAFAVVSMSVAELAEQTNTSKATVSRFFRQLGYESHQEAKQAMLARRSAGLPINETLHADSTLAENEANCVLHTLRGIPQTKLDPIIDKLCEASRVILIGYRNSFPVAMHFRQQLRQVRDSVHIYPQSGQTISEDLVDLRPTDYVVLIGFRRRPRIFKFLIESLKPYQTLMITDDSGQIYNHDVDDLLVCQLGERQALDSYAAPMSLVSILVNQSYSRLGDKARRRVATISERYDEYGELD